MRPPTLHVGTVHVWRVPLGGAVVSSAWESLDRAERARAERFHYEPDRRRYVLSHWAMRCVLGTYLEAEPHALRFASAVRSTDAVLDGRWIPGSEPAQAGSKPALGGIHSGSALQFNLSRSGDLGLLAVTLEREVGVDVERIRPISDLQDVARRFFAPVEVVELDSLASPAERLSAFYACWTRKEAYLKALGVGLALPLDAFAVTLLAGQRPALRSPGGVDQHGTSPAVKPAGHSDGYGAPQRYALQDLHPAPGYAAALASEGTCHPGVLVFDWPETQAW